MHVVMRGIAEVVLVGRPVGQAEFAEEAGFDQKAEGPVNRRAANLAAGFAEVGDEFVGVEMLVRVEDVANQDSSGLGELFAADFEKLAEFVFRVALLDERAERRGVRHEG